MTVKIAVSSVENNNNNSQRQMRPKTGKLLIQQTISLFKWFAKTTSFHGLSHVVEGKSKVRKVFWALAVMMAVTVVTSIITMRVLKYLRFETVTNMKAETSPVLEFPSVTICNYNLIKKSLFNSGTMGFAYPDLGNTDGQGNAYRYYLLCNLPSPFGYSTEEPRVTTTEQEVTVSSTVESCSTCKPVNASSRYDDVWELGWQLTDGSNGTLLDCQYNKTKCDSSWFKKSLSPVGNCYTFNYEDEPMQLIQKYAGNRYGLRLLLDIEKDEYTPDHLFIGLRVIVHSKGESVDTTRQGINIPAGMIGNLRITHGEALKKVYENMKLVTNMYAPWGGCDNDKTLRYSDQPYTQQACVAECRITFVLERCQCRPYFLEKHNFKACSDAVWIECVEPAIDDFDEHVDTICDCPISCYERTYTPQVSYLALTDEWQTNQNFIIHYNRTFRPYYFSTSTVGVRLYYDSMQKTTVTEKKALDEIGLLSEIGGQLGLFVGVSLLTICEILETLLLACNRKRLNMLND